VWLIGLALIAVPVDRGHAAAAAECMQGKGPTESQKAPPAERLKAAKQQSPHAQAKPSQGPVASDAMVRQALDSPVTFEFQGTPLRDVVQHLADFLRIQIKLDNKALSDVGVATDVPVTCAFRNVRTRTALGLMLRELDLTWTVFDGVLLITTPEKEDSLMEARVYDVRDLVLAKDEKCKPFNDFDSLIALITSTIKPTTWDQVGGPGAIAPFESDGLAAIVVNQTWRIQEQVENLLADLRKTKSTKPGQAVARRTVGSAAVAEPDEKAASGAKPLPLPEWAPPGLPKP